MQLKVSEKYDRGIILRDIQFKHILLNQDIEICSYAYETAIVILSGECSVIVQKTEYNLKRTNVFEEEPSAVYVPIQDKVIIKKISDFCEIAICQTSSTEKKKCSFISKKEVKKQERGKEGYKRYVFDIIDEKFDACSMILGETINFPGNWSSYPPHKHDEHNPPNEAKMEELYFFKISPENGFGFQRIYTNDGKLDETMLIRNNDIVLIPKGYHPVCIMPGYQIFYLWVLAGKNRTLMPITDPDYSWIED